MKERTVASFVVCLALLGMAACDSTSNSQEPKDVQKQDVVADSRIVPDTSTVHDTAADQQALEDLVVDSKTEETKPIEDVATGPQPPAPKKYSNGVCPVFTAGTNEIKVGTRTRKFELWVPAKPKGAPLVFVWHGLGDSPGNIAAFFQASKMAQDHGAVVVAPYDCCSSPQNQDCCSTPYVWGFGTYSPDSDMMMFDDLLACIEQQADIDNTRVYTTGFSAGALWSTHLVINRGEYLAAASIFSGGTGKLIKYATPGTKVPVLLAHGGPEDIFAGGLVKFADMILEFAGQLYADGHFVALCIHDLGHSVPYDTGTWNQVFLFAHKWGDTVSPFKDGLPQGFPEICSLYTPPPVQ